MLVIRAIGADEARFGDGRREIRLPGILYITAARPGGEFSTILLQSPALCVYLFIFIIFIIIFVVVVVLSSKV